MAEAHAKGAKVKLYYTVRELSTSATEFWALRALSGEVIVPSRAGGGHAWLREHVRGNYSAAWHERLADGEIDAAVSPVPWIVDLEPHADVGFIVSVKGESLTLSEPYLTKRS